MPKNKAEELPLSLTKNCATIIEQTQKKIKRDTKFRLTQPKKFNSRKLTPKLDETPTSGSKDEIQKMLGSSDICVNDLKDETLWPLFIEIKKTTKQSRKNQ